MVFLHLTYGVFYQDTVGLSSPPKRLTGTRAWVSNDALIYLFLTNVIAVRVSRSHSSIRPHFSSVEVGVFYYMFFNVAQGIKKTPCMLAGQNLNQEI